MTDKCYNEGVLARKRNESRDSCPYYTSNRVDWLRGWDDQDWRISRTTPIGYDDIVVRIPMYPEDMADWPYAEIREAVMEALIEGLEDVFIATPACMSREDAEECVAEAVGRVWQ